MENKKEEKLLVISYMTLRKAVGILGILFPVVLVIGSIVVSSCDEIQGSISNYYHTGMRNIFVGLLCSIALFLFSYKGYKPVDNLAGNLAGLFALGVAFFPTPLESPLPRCNVLGVESNPLAGSFHFLSAACLFGVLSFFSFYLFTRSSEHPIKNRQKLRRNRVYRICGLAMIFCILLIAAYKIFLEARYPFLVNYYPVFWLETIALWAFGISWLTKGEAILKDIGSEKNS